MRFHGNVWVAGAVAGPADTAGSLGADASGPRSPSARALAGCAQLGSPTEAVHATQAASTGTATETTAAACKSTPKAVQASSPLTGPLDEATPHAGGANEGIGADIDPAAAVSIGAATVKQSSVASAELAPADSDPTGTVAAATNAAATVATTNAAAATNDGAAADAAAVPAAIDANAAANTAATAADAAAAATNVATAADAAATTNAAAVAATNAAADAAASAPAHMGHAAIAADRGSSYSPASTAATPMPESGCALEDSTLSGVKQDGDDDPTPELSCRQAFAATQFATGGLQLGCW